MDDLLVRSAAAAGAQVRLRCRCESVATGRVRLRDLERNRLETLDADLILLADGKSSLLPGRVADPAGFGIKAHFNCPNAIPNTIELFGAKSCYGGIAPIEHGQFNLAFAIPKSRIRPDLDALLNQIASENPALRNRLRNATRLSDFLASPLPRFSVRGDWPPGIIPLGNAAAAIEPIGGEGMGLALRSAQIVCEQLLQADSVDSASIQRAYNRLWQMRSVICRAGGWMISRPMLCEVSARCLEANQTLASIVFSLAGKRAMSEPSTAR